MYHNAIYANMDNALPQMLMKVLRLGEEVGSRAGRVKELTHVGITLSRPWQRELLVEARKPNLAAQIAETMWVLAGRNDVEFLSHYLPRAADFSDDGKVWRGGYGPRLRAWLDDDAPGGTVDQLAHVVELLKRDPSTRQAVMSIYDPGIDTEPGKDIPCNNWLNFSSRLGRLDLHVAVRSNDAMWGWSGINAFEWSALQEIVAGLVGVEVGSLHFSTTSFHLYDRHWAKAEKIDSWAPGAENVPDSPRCGLGATTTVGELDALIEQWFAIEYDIRTGSPLAHVYVDRFPEPMMRSWLRVIQWWWSQGVRMDELLDPIRGTRLEMATRYAVQPPRPETKPDVAEIVDGTGSVVRTVLGPSDFLQHVMALHESKHAAYGDSWKKRGELFSIIPNIARKVDRLGNGETDDETQADTAIDLMVYLAKYLCWLTELDTDTTEATHTVLFGVEQRLGFTPWPAPEVRASACRNIEAGLKQMFDQQLLSEVEANVSANRKLAEVAPMLEDAYRLAATRWHDANPICGNCGSAKSNHGPGGSRYPCQFVTSGGDDYRGADHE